jgi:hypothetical protein
MTRRIDSVGPRRPNEQPLSRRPSTVYRIIWKAARARKQITCMYGGRYREACPHILGYKKLGQEAVFAFQFGGDTTSRLPPQGDWRCLDLAGVTEVQLRDGRWPQRDAAHQDTNLHSIRRRRRQRARYAEAAAAVGLRLAPLAAAAPRRRVA